MTIATRRKLPWLRTGGLQRRATPTYYRDGRLHPLCSEQVRPYCELCRVYVHKFESTPVRRLHCLRCVAREYQVADWYPSKNEAQAAMRLDGLKARGKVLSWRRGRRVILQEAIRNVQPSVTYQPDFVVELRGGGVEAWEIKGASCRCAWCRPGRSSPQFIEPDALLKIRWYRKVAQERNWPPLLVMTAAGAPIHV